MKQLIGQRELKPGQRLDADAAMDLAKGEGSVQSYVVEQGVSIYHGKKTVSLTKDEKDTAHALARDEWETGGRSTNLYALRLRKVREALAAKTTTP